jgi:hypothetical protein
VSLAEDLWVALATRWGEGLFTAQRDNLKKRWDLARGGPPGPALQWLQTRHQVTETAFHELVQEVLPKSSSKDRARLFRVLERNGRADLTLLPRWVPPRSPRDRRVEKRHAAIARRTKHRDLLAERHRDRCYWEMLARMGHAPSSSSPDVENRDVRGRGSRASRQAATVDFY